MKADLRWLMKNSGETQQLTERDRQRFHELYHRYYQRVYSTCLRMTRNVAESEDLTQEIFIHLFRTIGSFRGESAFTTWLHRVTVNHVLMYLRKCQRRAETTTEKGELPAYIAAGTRDPRRMRIVDRILLSEVFAKLPEGYRQAIILYDVRGLAHSEIAVQRHRSVGTSKSQLHKARAMLRELIAGRELHVNRQSVNSFLSMPPRNQGSE
jgi:RNA polymerase sigma-70 factor (ECF subfamily)